MSTIHGVNVGGSLYNVSDSSNVAPLEQTMFATRDYGLGRCMILADGLLYRAKEGISSGDPLVINGNIKRTSVDEIVNSLETDSDLIAPTEDGDTSSDDYAIGAQIARSGLLYKVIDDISEGDAFVVGNNIELAGNVTSQLYAVNKNLKNLSGCNLLDNPWFTVNQRGSSSYTELNKYSLDRWKIVGDSSSFSIAPDSDGAVATVSSENYIALEQPIEKAALALEREYTLSVMFGDGTVIKGTGLVSDVNVDTRFISTNAYIGKVTATLDYDSYNSLYLCRIFMNSPVSNLTIKAVKLELGSVSTLANDVAPNYAEELAKCQRYFERVSFPTNGSIGIGFAMDASNLTMLMPITQKRAWSSVTANVLSKIKYSRGTQGESASCTSITVHSSQPHYVMLKLGGTFTKGEPYAIYNDNQSGNYIDISADL